MLISQNTCETSFLFPLAALKLEASIALKGSKEIKRRYVAQDVLRARTRVRGTEARCIPKCIRLIHAFVSNVDVLFTFEITNVK